MIHGNHMTVEGLKTCRAAETASSAACDVGHVSHGMAAPERLPSLPYTKPQQGYVFVGGDGGGCGSHCLLSFNINRIVSEYRAFSLLSFSTIY